VAKKPSGREGQDRWDNASVSHGGGGTYRSLVHLRDAGVQPVCVEFRAIHSFHIFSTAPELVFREAVAQALFTFARERPG